jgi:uncharacterized protein (DUF2141 family)
MTLPRALALIASSLALSSAAQAQTCVPVQVQNVRADRGMLMVAAYDDEATYNKKPVSLLQLRADKDTLEFKVCGVGGAALALSMFQDINGNGKLDTNVLGIPSEPWGASGKPSAFEAPSWKSTHVPVDGGVVVVKLSQ